MCPRLADIASASSLTADLVLSNLDEDFSSRLNRCLPRGLDGLGLKVMYLAELSRQSSLKLFVSILSLVYNYNRPNHRL